MQKIPKSIVAIATVLVVSGVAFYYNFTKLKPSLPTEQAALPTYRPDAGGAVVKSKELSATTTYEVPGDKTDTLKFVVKLDATGQIEQITTLDAATNEIPEKKKEFNDQINIILKGKKLSELTKVDKVGKSTLTTNAFNAVLGDLKAQL